MFGVGRVPEKQVLFCKTLGGGNPHIARGHFANM